MYKIYINEAKFVLIESGAIDATSTSTEQDMIARYNGKPHHLLNYIDMCEKTDKVNTVVVHSDDFRRLKKDFLSLYKVVEAGGGVVVNPYNEILMIHRRGKWDLPKGKLDKGETRRQAAKREVEEETGIRGLQLGRKLCVTNHTYRHKEGKRCIKKSHWYLMYAAKQTLVPQVEEDIEQTVWMPRRKALKKRAIYPNILDVIHCTETKSKR